MRLIGAGTVEEKVYEKQVYKDGLRRTLTTATRKANEGEEGCQGGGGGDGGRVGGDITWVGHELG